MTRIAQSGRINMIAPSTTRGNAVVARGARSHDLTVIDLDDRRPGAAAMTGFTHIGSGNMSSRFPTRCGAVVA